MDTIKNNKEEHLIRDNVKECLAHLSRCDGYNVGTTGIPSGFRKLDEITCGFQKGDVIVISGLPAMGKTAFALSMAATMVLDNGSTILFDSFEMNNKRLVNRLISSVCSIPLHSINCGVLTEEDWKIIERRIISLQHAPLLLDDTPSMTLDDLRESCHRTMEKFHMKGVFIDSLQHIKTEYRANRTRNDDISELMYGIKALAYELDIPIFVISSMNRYADRRDSLEGKRPQLSDLRESGAIEDVADLVMFVHRPEMFHIYQDDCGRDLHGAAQIIIAKNRMGRTGDVLLSFKGDYVRFENPEPF